MFDTSSIILFLSAAFFVLVVPGPAVIYITTRSLDQGTKAGIVSTIGIAFGSVIHVGFAAFGLSAILVTSAYAFAIIKFAGAAYLIYLGITKLFSKTKFDFEKEKIQKSNSKMFVEGMLVNLLNPKTALFFFSFLPQFADAANGSIALQIFILGMIFVLMGLVSDSLYAIVAGTFQKYILTHPRILNIQKYVTGSIYILLGAVTALTSGSRTK